jgi:hypothetical protein
MENYNKNEILNNLINEKYERIFCGKCMNTFLTSVYGYDDTHVLLEKRALGLEYFCDAIHEFALPSTPQLTRIGVLDEDDNIIDLPEGGELFSKKETEYRYIYVMEKMEHLDEKEARIFDKCIKNLDWIDDLDRRKALKEVGKKFGIKLQMEVELLFSYYEEHQDYILWDLHGDNLMKRIDTGDVVFLDPFAIKV